MKKIFVFLSLSLLAASTVSSQRLLTEDFNYSIGQLTSVSGSNWLHFTGTTKPIQVIAGNLTYPGYITSPSSTSALVLLDSSISNAEDAFIRFGRVDSSTVYCTFLLNVLSINNLFGDTSNKGEAFIGFLPFSNNIAGAAGVAIQKGATRDNFKLGVFPRINTNPPSVVWSDSNYAINSTL